MEGGYTLELFLFIINIKVINFEILII